VKQLSPSYLVAFFGMGFVAGLSSSQLASGFGQSFLVSPLTLLIVLPLIGIANFIASFPIYRYRRKSEKRVEGARPNRPNPFYAYRVLVVSRAVALTGALFSGWHLGQLVWLLSFSVAPAGLVNTTLLGVVGSLSMLGGGLISEANCRAPRDPGEGTE